MRVIRFNPEYPEDYESYDCDNVVGVQFRREDAIRFFNGNGHSLEFEWEPTNKHDRNAIKVWGITQDPPMRVMLGYVPKKMSKAIKKSRVQKVIRPVLIDVAMSLSGWVGVSFDIVGPKEILGKYEDAMDTIRED